MPITLGGFKKCLDFRQFLFEFFMIKQFSDCHRRPMGNGLPLSIIIQLVAPRKP